MLMMSNIKLLRSNTQKMSVVEIIMLRWTSGITLRNGIRSEYIHKKLEIALIEDKMRETNWYGLDIYNGVLYGHWSRKV